MPRVSLSAQRLFVVILGAALVVTVGCGKPSAGAAGQAPVNQQSGSAATSPVTSDKDATSDSKDGQVICSAVPATSSAVEKKETPAKSAKAKSELADDIVEQARKAYEEEQKELKRRLDSDPAWRPTHQKAFVIKADSQSKPMSVNNFCLGHDGSLLVACGGERAQWVADEKTREPKLQIISESAEIRVLDPNGKMLETWGVDFKPEAICAASDGMIFVGGGGKIAKFSAEGKLLAAVDSPVLAEEMAAKKADKTEKKSEKKQPSSMMGAIWEGLGLAEKKSDDSDAARAAAREQRRSITGIAVSGRDLFVACPMKTGWGYSVWRMDLDLGQPKEILTKLTGCCGQMDIQAKDGELWVAHNARHRVERYDREGKKLSAFGKRDRKKAEGFGGCCEPKNLRFGPAGELYTSESGPPVAIKRFSPEGKFLNVVAVPEYESGCVRVTVEVARGGDRVYVLSPSENAIYVLDRKPKGDAERKAVAGK